MKPWKKTPQRNSKWGPKKPNWTFRNSDRKPTWNRKETLNETLKKPTWTFPNPEKKSWQENRAWNQKETLHETLKKPKTKPFERFEILKRNHDQKTVHETQKKPYMKP